MPEVEIKASVAETTTISVGPCLFNTLGGPTKLKLEVEVVDGVKSALRLVVYQQEQATCVALLAKDNDKVERALTVLQEMAGGMQQFLCHWRRRWEAP